MSGWRELFARAVDPASLIVFRVAWGGLMLFHVVSYLSTGRLQRQYIDPPFHFYFPGFSWLRVAPPDVMKWLFVLMALSALGIALGAFYRWAAGFFFFAITYVFLIDPAFYQNHLYLISLISLWVWILPLHRVASVDADGGLGCAGVRFRLGTSGCCSFTSPCPTPSAASPSSTPTGWCAPSPCASG